jgi:two-component system cell cycle response regulator DivK
MSRILVVEDNLVNMRLVCELLRYGGHEADTATNADEACALLSRNELPSLVLLDLQIPGGGGLRVLQHIRADARLAPLRVVALTAQAMQGDRERILGLGFDHYIAKPIEVQTFGGQIEVLLAAGGRSRA